MKKFLVLCSTLAIVLSGFFIPIQKATAVSTADQYCMNTNPASYESLMRNEPGSNYRQAFTPTQNRINSVAVKVGGNGITGLATLRVFSAPTGFNNELLRSDRNFTNLNAEETWYFNDFGDVTITPGTTYYISLTTSIDFLYWYSVPAGECTPTGMAYKDGAQMGYKLHYSTFGFTEAVADTGTTTGTGTATTATTSTTSGETLGTSTTSIVKPTNLTATYSDTDRGVKLAWKASATADIDGYKVFRYEGNIKTPVKIASTTKDKLEYLDIDVVAGKTYSYQVRAYKTDTQSVSSNIANATVPADAAPAKPVNFKVVDRTFNSLEVMWRKSTDPNISGYTLNLYKGGEKIRTADVPVTIRNYFFLKLDSGTVYKIDLVAKNAKGVASTPAITAGFTELPEATERFMDITKSIAVIVVLILLLILAINTKKHYKNKV